MRRILYTGSKKSNKVYKEIFPRNLLNNCIIMSTVTVEVSLNKSNGHVKSHIPTSRGNYRTHSEDVEDLGIVTEV